MVEPPSVANVLEIAEIECAVWYESREAMDMMEPPRGSFSESDDGGRTGVGVSFGSGEARTVSIEDNDGS